MTARDQATIIGDQQRKLVKTIAKEDAPSNSDAMKAIQTLHKYFSQPAVIVPMSMHELLGKTFLDVISEDPFKK